MNSLTHVSNTFYDQSSLIKVKQKKLTLTNFQKFIFKSPFKRTTKKIKYHPIKFPTTQDICEKITKIIDKDKNLQTIRLKKSKTSLVVPIDLIHALSNQPTCSIEDLFKTQKFVFEDGELILNSFERQLLMQESSYFKSFWNGYFKESQLNHVVTMDIPKNHLEIIINLLKFSKLKTDQWQYWSMKELISVLDTVNFLHVPKLFDVLQREIIDRVRHFNRHENFFTLAIDLWQFAYANDYKQIQQEIEDYFSYLLRLDLDGVTINFKNLHGEESVFIERIKCLSTYSISSISLTCRFPNLPYNYDRALENLTELRQLQSFGLKDWCALTDKGLESLKKFEHLQSLNLSCCCNVTDKGFESLKELKELKHLNLTGCCKLTNQGLGFLKELKNLHSLNLTGCYKLTSEGLEILKEFKNLQDLNLTNCYRLTDEVLEIIKEMKHLRYLTLTGCYKLTDKGIEILKELKYL